MSGGTKPASGAIGDFGRRLLPLLGLLAIIAIIALLAGSGSPFLQRRVTLGLIDLTAVVGLYIFVGNSGILSFGHVGFMAIAAYVSAILSMKAATKGMFLPALIEHAELPPILSGLIGAACATLFASLVGLVLMRLSGMSASIATFALLIIVYVVIGNWDSITGGQRSLMGIPATVGLWSSFAIAATALALAFAYQETRGALALRAAREDEVAARASGVRVYRERVIAFTVSAFVSGLSGAAMAHLLGTVRVDSFYLDLTFIIIAMLVVGGARSLAGAVAGTIAIVGLTEVMRLVEAGVPVPGTPVVLAAPAGLGDVLVAAFMLLMIIFRPAGLANGNELRLPLRLRRG